MSEPFIGEIRLVGFSFAPRGWASCDGQLLPIAGNEALFSLLGTTYGGDGRTNFALPDLRGRCAIGDGQGPGLSMVRLGERSGHETATLSVQNLPAHTHEVSPPASDQDAAQRTPGGMLPAAGGSDARPLPLYAASASGASMSAYPTGSTGGNIPVDVRAPYLGMNYVIALTGIFPSRN